jgi:hypothetical protein
MEYVGRDLVTTIVEEFDQQVLMPLLVVVSKHLNLDKLIMILKNWPSDATTIYASLTTMKMAIFLKVENRMLDNFEEELDDASILIAHNNVP